MSEDAVETDDYDAGGEHDEDDEGPFGDAADFGVVVTFGEGVDGFEEEGWRHGWGGWMGFDGVGRRRCSYYSLVYR